MKIRCPECNAEYDVAVETIGQIVECQCGKQFRAELERVVQRRNPINEFVKRGTNVGDSSTKANDTINQSDIGNSSTKNEGYVCEKTAAEGSSDSTDGDSSSPQKSNSCEKPAIAVFFSVFGVIGLVAGFIAFMVGVTIYSGENNNPELTKGGGEFIAFSIGLFFASAQFFAIEFIIEKVNLIAHNSCILASMKK